MAVDFSSLVLGPCMNVFGETVNYVSSTGSFNVTGVFDEAYIEVTPLGVGGMASEAMAFGLPGAITTEMPALGVQLSQFASMPAQGDTLTVRNTFYTVKEVRVDGHGGATLLLSLY